MRCSECSKTLDGRTKESEKCFKCKAEAHKTCASKILGVKSQRFQCKKCSSSGEVSRPDHNTSSMAEMIEMSSKIDRVLANQGKFEEKLTSIENRFIGLDTKINAMETKITALEVSVETMDPLVKFTSDKMHDLEARIKRLESSVKRHDKNSTEETRKISEISKDVEYIKEKNRRHNVEIQGIPQQPNETSLVLINYVTRAAFHFGIEIDKTNIRNIHRIPTYNGNMPQPIIVSFTSIVLRDQLLQKVYDNKNGLTGENIDLPTKQRIFIATHLTPQKKELFKKARDAKKKDGVAYVWERHGNILARATEVSATIKIKTEEDIEKVVSQVPPK